MSARKYESKSVSEILGYLTDLLDEIRPFVSDKDIEKHLLALLLRIEGYFTEEFTAAEFVRMYYNIDMDFPIFMETSLGDLQQKVKELENELGNLKPMYQGRGNTIEALDADITDMRRNNEKLLLSLVHNPLTKDECSGDENYLDLYLYFDHATIVKAKLKEGIKLTEQELSFACSKINS